MAQSTAKEKAYAREYYKTHPKQRQKAIDKQLAKQKANPKKYAKIQKKRYHSDKEYRDYKIEYARDYYKKNKYRYNKSK